MPLPCPGPAPISLLDIQNEFDGGIYPTGIDEYYRGGLYVTNITENNLIPTSGLISFQDFFCSTGEIVVYVTQNTDNLNIKPLFGVYWNSLRSKRLVINSGVVLCGRNPFGVSNITNGYGMIIYDDFVGNLTIENRGSIQGAGGRRGGDAIISGESRTDSNNGGNGGNAIYIGPTSFGGTKNPNNPIVKINNLGTILAGGGGGGKGSGGSTGSSTTYSYRPYGSCCPLDITITSTGSSGGLGGWGQGCNQSNTNGTLGFSISANITSRMNSLGCNAFIYPPGSNVTHEAVGSGQNGIHRFGSNTTLTYNMYSSGTPDPTTRKSGGLSFRGTNNNIVLNRYSSGFTGSITKDPNQSFTDNRDVNSWIHPTINNVVGGGQETPEGQISFSTNGIPNTTISISASSASSGGGGGAFGNNGSSAGFAGGSSGYSIVNASQYVSYISQGTIAGPTT